ncbi:MAG: class I SAM-dependent methyltransferase [Calditrichia bacterium]
MTTCSLCQSEATAFHRDTTRDYFHCSTCHLVFVPQSFHLTPDEEKRRYDNHDNNPEDPRYRQFLSQMSEPLIPLLPTGASGLDFGCGPGPALARMLKEADFEMTLFDPYYANNPEVLEKIYDFVVCTETAEHFRNPEKEWKTLVELVKEDGYLGIMTQQLTELKRFPTWHYIRDDTHVSFYSRETFDWLANSYTLNIVYHTRTAVIFKKGTA